MSRSRRYLASGLLVAVFLLFATWLIGGWGGTAAAEALSDVGSLLAGGFAAGCAGVTAWSGRGRQRWAWVALTVGLVGWIFGDAFWAYSDLVSEGAGVTFPSAGDLGYLLFPIGACVALILLPIGGPGQSQIRLVLDGLIVAGSLFVIMWASGLESVFREGGESRFAFAVSMAYPLSDLVLLTVAVLVLARARTGQRATISVLTGAVCVIAFSDVGFVLLNAGDDYFTGSLIDVGWVAALLLLGSAAIIGARSGHIQLGLAQVPPRWTLWLPYAPLPFAVACMVRAQPSGPLLVSALLLVSAVLLRQLIVSDENRRLLGEVAEQAFRDPLTGLANRALFQDRLAHAMALQHRDAQEVAMLSIDMDDFKLVNDSLGHPAGDALLKAAAARILECVGPGDTVARTGGDEFAILLEDGLGSPLIVAHRVVDAFDEPFAIDGHHVFIRPSVGVAAGSAAGDARYSAETLLKHADLALYTAKRSLRGGVHSFTPDMTMIDVSEVEQGGVSQLTSRRRPSPGLQLFAQLRRAIDQDELSLVYQPKFTVSSGHVAGVEALVRWQHPQRGLLLPGEFLPLARQNGLMGALTEAVVRRAVGDAASWRAQGTGVPFAINLFPPSLGDLGLPRRIVGIFAEKGLITDCLTVEITEDFLLGNIRRAREVLQMLRDLNVRISIDDFGTGYSSLSYLRELPIDELKLDRHFIAPILSDERADAIVGAVVDLAHRLGMTCVAEGVEDAATAARVAEHGCDMIQGYFCSKPVAAEDVLEVRRMAPPAVGARTAR